MKKSAQPILIALLFLGCFLFGFSWRDIQRGELPKARALNALIGGGASRSTLTPEQVFKQNYGRILTYYRRDLKPLELKYAGMQGMMSSLGDPHTMFLPPKMAQQFNEDTKANFFGVGAKLQPDPIGAKVATVFEDGPAYAAGMRTGDFVVGVNGEKVAGKEIDEIVEKVKGPEGTVVKLQLLKSNSTDPITISVRRARITTPTVESKYLPESKVGYMTVASFSEPTGAQFDKELNKLEQNDLRGLVIDVRDNPGGLLETATDILSRFVENKTVVTMKFRSGHEEVERTYSGAVHRFKYPVVVLMNQYSASAAEIFAGALKDYGRATLVGEHTYGKASVQNVFPLIDMASAKITIAKYYLPSGEFIGRRVDDDGVYISGGVHPDVEAKLNLDSDVVITPGDPATDTQMKKAIDVILGLR